MQTPTAIPTAAFDAAFDPVVITVADAPVEPEPAAHVIPVTADIDESVTAPPAPTWTTITCPTFSVADRFSVIVVAPPIPVFVPWRRV